MTSTQPGEVEDNEIPPSAWEALETSAPAASRPQAPPLVTREARASDPTIEIVRPQFERLFVMTAEQALEQDLWTLRLHARDRERVIRYWFAWCAGPCTEPFTCTYRMLTAEGRVIWVDEEAVLDGDPANTPRRYRRHLLKVVRQRRRLVALGHRRGDHGVSAGDGAAAETRSLIVCCLACGARYRRPAGHDTLEQRCCPRCEYVGWTAAD